MTTRQDAETTIVPARIPDRLPAGRRPGGRSTPVWLQGLGLLVVAAFFGGSLVLLGRVIGSTSPWLAVLVMFYFLALAKLAEPLIVLRMPRRLSRLRPWEVDGRLSRRLGVLRFGRLLRDTPLRHLNARVYLGNSPSDPRRVRLQAASAEACHFWAAVLLAPFIGVAAVAGRWSVVAGFLVTQLLVNLYPILHLRSVRGRLDRTIERQIAARSARQPPR